MLISLTLLLSSYYWFLYQRNKIKGSNNFKVHGQYLLINNVIYFAQNGVKIYLFQMQKIKLNIFKKSKKNKN